MKKIKAFFKTKLGIVVGVVIIILFSTVVFRSKSSSVDTITVEKSDFVKTVSVSGKVVAVDNVDLSFETGGTVASVYKKVGDTVSQGEAIAALDSSDIRASRDKAVADLVSAQAKLAKLQSGVSDSSEVSINKQQVINTIVDAYTVCDDAIRNKVDQFFNDGQNQSPRIKYSFYNDVELKYKINEDRKSVEDALVAFKSFANNITVENYSNKNIESAKMYIQKVKEFLSEVSLAVNSFEVALGLTQTSIDKYKADIGSARSSVNGALAELSSFEDKLHGSLSDIPVQQANVMAAEATVRNFDAQIAKTVIVAPFSGVISLQDAKAGESVAAHAKMTSMISRGYKVEAYVPEINISGIAVGNTASVTLDAYGDERFEASIIHIDPAETVRDGVSNYKVELSFNKEDPRILSGMTADVSIVTQKIPSIIIIPERIVTRENDISYVTKSIGDKTEKTQVVLGRKDGKGNIEVTSGLSVGDKLVLNP